MHVKPVEGAHALRDGGRQFRFKCRRCFRDLPDIEFEALPPAEGLQRFLYLHPYCYTCRKQLKSKWAAHPLVTPARQRYVHRLVLSARGGAQARGIIFAVTEDDVLQRFVEQQGKCALTGESMTLESGTRIDRARAALSIDRIESSRNYTIDNIHLVCRVINLMKSDMSLEEFGRWCSRMVLHGLDMKATDS